MVYNFTRSVRSRLTTSLLTFLAVAICLNFDRLLEIAIPSLNVATQSVSSKTTLWNSSVFLNKGSYYLSVGRPQGSCNLNFNSTTVDTSAGNGLVGRSALILGAKIEINVPQMAQFELVCEAST